MKTSFNPMDNQTEFRGSEQLEDPVFQIEQRQSEELEFDEPDFQIEKRESDEDEDEDEEEQFEGLELNF